MYHPYFRGKQYELLAVRECASTFSENEFTPIIEPVKSTLSGLNRALDAVNEMGGGCVLIVNPLHGDCEAEALRTTVAERTTEFPSLRAGLLLHRELTLADAIELVDWSRNYSRTFVHCGMPEARQLIGQLGDAFVRDNHVFAEDCGLLYISKFGEATSRVLLNDGFVRRRNADYQDVDVEFYSELHLTFRMKGATGFGDYLTVGDDYSESGGPAYAIAIHLTFVDPNNDDVMFVRHYVSDRRDTPVDPAGKFMEALRKLVDSVVRPDSKILRTSAVEEFLELHERRHFPGLGYVKKLSMKHHVELVASLTLEE